MTDTPIFLIFSIKNERFAIETNLVQEIMHGAKVYFLPFVPDYIEGIINFRGQPCTVVNWLRMNSEQNEFEDAEEVAARTDISGQTFIVFKRTDDLFGLHISNIERFYEVEEDDIRENAVAYKNKEIPIFNPDAIEESLRRDLGSDYD